jgi:hypothetical protein
MSHGVALRMTHSAAAGPCHTGLTNATCYAAAVARMKGLKARPSRAAAAAAAGTPVEPLHLWTYEAGPGRQLSPVASRHALHHILTDAHHVIPYIVC